MDSNAERAEVAEVSGLRRQNFPRPRRTRRFDRLRDLSSPLRRRGGKGRRDGFKRRARRGHRGFWSWSTKLSASSAFRSSPRSLVPAAAPRRQRTPRRIQTPSAPRSQRFLVLVDKTFRVLGVSLVSAISRRRCGAEEAEDAETDSNAERAEVAELFPMFLKNSPRTRRSRRLDRLRDLSSP
jgi:hypothetical protein